MVRGVTSTWVRASLDEARDVLLKQLGRGLTFT